MDQQLVPLLVLVLVSAIAAQGGVVPIVRTMPLLPNVTVVPAPHIVGGSKASRGQFPHQAAIFIDDAMFCGGSLISDSYILTAGHCVQSYSHWIIYLGSLDLALSEGDRQVAQSVDATLHEGYADLGTLVNDVALLYLRSPVALTFAVRPAELATDNDGTFQNMQAKVSGWGKLSDYTDSISNILYYTELTVLSNADCAKSYAALIGDWSICATGGGFRNPCNGDSGGALMVAFNDKVLQVGVTSFVSSSGCQVNIPSGYSRVSYFRAWIKANSGV